MIDIRPFRAVRPPRDKAYLVATRSYVSYSTRQHRDKLEYNPYTLLHVIDPQKGRNWKPGKRKYQLVRERYEDFCQKEIFIRDEKESFYLYRQIKDGNEYMGIIAAVSVKDYLENRIKKHEHTLEKREKMFTDYLENTGFNAEPVLLTYRDDNTLNQLMARYLKNRSEYEFTSTDKVLHQLWMVNSTEDIKQIQEAFEQQEALYIADGHHRSASSALLSQRMDDKGHKGDAHHYFMAFLIGEEQLKVYDYNRLVKGIGEQFLHDLPKKLRGNFWVEPKDVPYVPQKIHEIGLYREGQWFKLVPKTGTFDPSDAVEHLDAQILSDLILKPLLEVVNLKTDNRVAFMPGTEGVEGLKKAVDSGNYQMAFNLHPVTMEQVKKVADADAIMPPKTTYVEPKLRSGLVVYELW